MHIDIKLMQGSATSHDSEILLGKPDRIMFHETVAIDYPFLKINSVSLRTEI